MDVKGPDGKIVRFPDGTDNAKIDEVMTSIYAAKPAAPSAPPQATRSQSYGATDLAASKVTMGLSDKVGAAGEAVGGYLGDLMRGKDGGSVGDRYSRSYAAELAAKDAYKAAHPGVDWGTLPLNLAVGLPGKAVAGAATVIEAAKAALKEGTKIGAVTGGLSAAASSSGSATDQAGQIAFGTGVGAGSGALASHFVPKIIAAGGNVGKPYAQRIMNIVKPREPLAESGVDSAVQSAAPAPPSIHTSAAPSTRARPQPSRAQMMIGDAIEADGSTPRRVGQQIEAANQRGVPLAIMDTGDNVRGLAVGVGNAPGRSRTVIRDAAIARQEGQTERVQGAINRDLGRTTGVATEAQRLEQSAKTAAEPLYTEAYAHGAVNDPTITALMEHPEMKAALDAGKQIHANDVFLAKATGQPAPPPLPEGAAPDVRTMDYAKRALDRKIDAAYSGDAQSKMQLPFLKELRSTMLKALDNAVPSYGAARRAYAGPMQSAEALSAGKAAINKSADDIAAATADFTPSELDQFKLGLRSALSDKLEGQTDGGAKAHALVGTPKKRAVLSQMFGGEEGFDRFMATVADEAKTSATHARVAQGSPTSRNFADDANVAGETSVGASVVKAGAKAALGHPLSALKGLLGDANDRAARKAGEGVRAELAAALSETDPTVLAEALRMAQRARAQTRLDARVAAPRGNAAAATTGRAGGYAAQIVGGGQ